MQVLQQTLPSQVFTMLIQQMRTYGNRVAESQMQYKHQQPQAVNISELNEEELE